MMKSRDQLQSTRRHFLASNVMNLGALALPVLLQQQSQATPRKPDLVPEHFDLTPKKPGSEPRAKAMISLWMQGGPSHIDLFDPKPILQKKNGEKFPGKIKYDNAAQSSAKMLGSPWKFRQHGESGMALSELLPSLAERVDDITLIRSMRTGVNNHGQSIRAMHNGTTIEGQPSLGSWLSYGLGAETSSLPAFCAMIDPGQLPVLGVENWSNGYLPSIFQGTVIRPQDPRILNLTPPAQLQGKVQQNYLSYLQRLNRQHLERRPRELDLAARIAVYDLATRMQSAAREAMDLSRETQETKDLYGMNDSVTADYGARCLIARRLVERGVRFVQVYTQNQFWDHHGNIRSSLPAACRKVDKPSAALLTDLKRRGLLDSTVVHWGGEMGRLPVIQNDTGHSKVGRDHNTYGFSMWVAGGGFQQGCIHGKTDEFGHEAVEDVVNHYDYHATLLHLFGLNPDQLVYEQNSRPRKLTEKHPGRIVQEILA
ncbi:MAG TPA: DUF1501 domain-containing protein [Planctomycetaceae bacterium]|nr:DUF1501 domain-containing protein [Planctomycetaceae bacterium]